VFRYEQEGGSASLAGIALRSADAAGAQLRLAGSFALAVANDLSVGQVGAGNASFTVGGGSVIQVGGALSVEGGSTIQLQSRNAGGQVAGQWQGQGVEVLAADVFVGAGSAITADAQGYGPGAGPAGVGSGNSGGTHGGMGGRGPWGSPVTATYGDSLAPLDLGSGGGTYDGLGGGQGGAGGGAIHLEVTAVLTLDGEISADGQDMNTGRGDGGGAGGSVYVVTHGLTGAGIFTAEGGSSIQNRGGGGGGGRIAVRYADAAGYTGFAGTTVAGGTGANLGQAGTSVFIDSSVPLGHLRFYQRFVFAAGSQVHYGAITVDDAASLEIGGGAELTVDGALSVRGNSTVLIASANAGGTVGGLWVGAGATLIADTLTIEAGSRISADSQGYPQGAGPGSVGGSGNSGGTHAGIGGDAYWGAPNPTPYGNALAPLDLGSGGGTYDGLGGGQGGAGGGALRVVVVGRLTLDGDITANGQSMNSGRADGGGAGGSVYVWSGALAGSGRFSADGGASVSNRGGGGGGGRVVVSASTVDGAGQMTARGGNGSGPGGGGQVTLYSAGGSPAWTLSAAGGSGGAAGSAGIVSTAAYAWIAVGTPCSHDLKTVRWAVNGVDPATTVFRLTAANRQGETLLASGPVWATRAEWDTTLVPDGVYELRTTFLNAAGDEVGRLTRQVLVNNSVFWHSGPISANETWTPDRVHIVEGDVTLAAGVTVTVEPGTVVKLLDGTRITVSNGARLDASGAAGTPVIITSLQDDTAGGDTNLDGAASRPLPGNWAGVSLAGSGALGRNEYTEIRYAQASHTGVLAGDQTWDGSWTHLLSGDVTVPNGVTLTIAPGAVVKISGARGITVQAGGGLSAVGTVAQPITFTSVKDDSVGGDTNADGGSSAPAPGDWKRLFLDGGQAVLDHCDIRYGAGPDSVNDALIRTSGAAQLTLANSRLTDGLYTGVLAWGGTVTVTNTVIAGLDRGISAHPGSPVAVTNCTLDGNRLGLVVHGGSLTAVNCIVSNSQAAGVQFDFGTAPELRYCDVWSAAGPGYLNYSSTADLSGSAGNLAVDPLYKDTARRDFRLDYRSPCIDAGDGGVAPATDLAGAPRYNDPRTVDTGVPMPGRDEAAAVPDLGAFEFVETATAAIDLVVTGVSGPLQATVGDTVTVQWTVTNLGTAAATGPWHDTVYLLRDPDTAPVAVPAGEVLVGQGVHLGPGQSTAMAAEVRVPGSTTTVHRWQVSTNNRGEVFEGMLTANNRAVSAHQVSVIVPEMVAGGAPVTGTASAAGDSYWFSLVLPATVDTVITLEAGAAAAGLELYGAVGYVPDRSRYEVRQTETSGGMARLFVPASGGGVCYVLVYVDSLSEGPAAFTLQAGFVGFAVVSVTPREVGDCGVVTFTVQGGGLTAGCTCSLIAADGSAYAAAAVQAEGTTALAATVDLMGVPRGEYAVRIAKGGAVVELPGAVVVTACQPAEMWLDVVGRPQIRGGGQQTYRVTYGNRGNVDLPETYIMLGAAKRLRLLSASIADAVVSDHGGDGSVLLLALPRIAAQQSAAFEVQVKAGVSAGNSSLTGFAYAGHHAYESVSRLPDPEVEMAAEVVSQTADRLEMVLHVSGETGGGDLQCVFTREQVAESRDFTVSMSQTGDEIEAAFEFTVEPGFADPLFAARAGKGLATGGRGWWDAIKLIWKGGKATWDTAKRGQGLSKSVKRSDFQRALTKCLRDNKIPGTSTPWINEEQYNNLINRCDAGIFTSTVDLVLTPVPGGNGFAAWLTGMGSGLWYNELQSQRNGDPAFLQFTLKPDASSMVGDELINQLLSDEALRKCVCKELGIKQLRKGRGLVAEAATATCPCRDGEANGGEPSAEQCKVFCQTSTPVAVVTSQDPNEKASPVGVGAAQFVAAGTQLTYAVAFENTASATAPAAMVEIRDVLDSSRLDLSTFELGPLHFRDRVITPPAGRRDFAVDVDLRPETEVVVRIVAGLAADTGVATWRFTALDAGTLQPCEDPLLGVLPPNRLPPEGEGSVFFAVRPLAGLPTGTAVTNRASIVFDANAPIVTNTVVNTLDLGVPTGSVTALPAVSPYPDVAVSWSGTDDAGGSGVAGYDVFVAVDGGSFTSWLSGSTAVSAVFAGERGHRYAFYAVARDGVGHTEVQAEPLDEAQTVVPLLADDTDGDGLPDWFEALIINAAAADAVAGFADVSPWGDFDADGALNLHEYRAGTDPTDPLAVPAAVAPEGETLVVVAAADVVAGCGLWDVSGTYALAVGGNPLVLNLVHDSRGKLSGTARYEGANATVVTMPVRGSVRGSAGVVRVKIALQGVDATRTTRVALALDLAVNAGTRQLVGRMLGTVKVGAARTPVATAVAVAIPAPMDGTWTLALELVQNARSITGTALLTLSNGVDYSFPVLGRVAGQAVVLKLAGGAEDRLSGIGMWTTVTPLEGHWARLEALTANAYGQTLTR
jgi:hypothetical protein